MAQVGELDDAMRAKILRTIDSFERAQRLSEKDKARDRAAWRRRREWAAG